MELKGKTALVTGGAKRVGRAIALELARRGSSIIVHFNTSKTDAETTASDIRKFGVEAHVLQADLEKKKDIEALTESLRKKNISPDILVNSASLFFKTPLEKITEVEWDKLLNTNLKGPFFLSKEIGAGMVRKGSGKIINIADWSAFRPYRDYAAYCASKGGLLTLTKSLARELAPAVQANAVAPGPILRPPDMTEEESQAVAKQTALGRWGKPEDIAHAVCFLAENDFINGTVLVVDGGRSIV